MTDWATHFRQSAKCSISPMTKVSHMTTDFGSDASDAVLAYRTLWNNYVLNSIRAMDDMATNLATVATNPPDGFTSDELNQLATSYGTERDDSLTAWNQFAGKSTTDTTAEADIMVSAFQQVVSDMQKFWKDEKVQSFNTIPEPAQPSSADQKKVAAQIKAAVSSKSSLALAIQSLIGVAPSLPTLPDVGSAALQFLKDHWLGISLVVVGVGVGAKVVGLAGKTYLKIASGGFL